MGIVEEAQGIAARELRLNYTKHGILASLGNWSQIWARDSLFASWGADTLEAKDRLVVRHNLATLMHFQKPNGQLPLRVGGSAAIPKLLRQMLTRRHITGHSELKWSARYRLEKFPWFPVPMDGNALLPVTALDYLNASKDIGFIRDNLPKIKAAIEWLLKRLDNGLVRQGRLADWEDSVHRRGNVLYTNVLTCEALRAMGEIYKALGMNAERFFALSEKLKAEINKRFWNKQYYIDALSGRPFKRFSTDGNLLAIVFGIASKPQGRVIQAYISRNRICRVPCMCNFPPYPSRYIDLYMRLYGFPNYLTNTSWLWLGCLNVVAKTRLGMHKQAHAELERLSRIITKHEGVFEVYDSNGNPAKKGFYSSEPHFAWSAGLFLYAVKAAIP